MDQEHSRAIAERFQHWPQAAIVYFGILVSPCKVMMEEPDARVLVVPDHSLGTNDCRGWIRRSLFQRLQQKHDDELLASQIDRLRRERHGNLRDEDMDASGKSALVDDAKHEIARKRLPDGRFYQFRMAFADTQAKGSFKIMEDDVADALEADFVLPESAVKPGLKIPAVMYSIFGPGRRFRGHVAVGIREVSRQLEFESSYTLVEHAPEDSIQLEILPQAMKQVAKLSEAVGEGRYEELAGDLGPASGQVFRMPWNRTPTKNSGSSKDCSWPMQAAKSSVILTSTINSTNCLRAGRSRQRLEEASVCRHLRLMDDGYLFLKDGKVFCGSDWIPEHKAIVPLGSKHGLCVRYPDTHG